MDQGPLSPSLQYLSVCIIDLEEVEEGREKLYQYCEGGQEIGAGAIELVAIGNRAKVGLRLRLKVGLC